ncbi:MAG: hypothetical protein AAF735_03135 [Myxococcota bacterium]
MLSLLWPVIVSAPSWAGELNLRPPAAVEIEVEGDEAPSELMVLPAGRFSSLTINGRGRLELSFYGIESTRGRRQRGPGKVTIRQDRQAPRTIDLRGKPRSWRVPSRPEWRLTQVRRLDLQLTRPKTVLVLRPNRRAKQGVLLRANWLPDGAPPAPVASSPGLNTNASAGAEPPLIAADTEPPLVAAQAEPPIVSDVEAKPVESVEPGFTIEEPRAASQLVRAERGDALFLKLTTELGLKLEARGTGVLVFDYHAHRDPARPPSLEPVVIGMLLDDVLVDTLAIRQPATDDYTVTGADYQLSERTQFQLTVPSGRHRIELSLSDNALAGGSIRVRFASTDLEAVTTTEPPVPPTPPPLVQLQPSSPDQKPKTSGWVGVGVGGEVVRSNNTGAIGGGGHLELFVMPGASSRAFGFGLQSGFRTVETSSSIVDPRLAGGSTTVRLTERSVPVLADLRLSLEAGDTAWMLGVGGGGLVSWARTDAASSRVETDVEWVWAAMAHITGLIRLGPGWLSIRMQWTATEPAERENLRDFDPGVGTVGLGYVFGTY